MSSSVVRLTLSPDAVRMLDDLLVNGAGRDVSEVVDRLLTAVLPQYRAQAVTLQEQQTQISMLQARVVTEQIMLQQHMSGGDAGALQPPTPAGEVHATTSLLRSSAGGRASGHRNSGEVSDVDSDEDATGGGGASDDGSAVGGGGARPSAASATARKRFFKSIHGLDPSARRKRKAKFCRSLLGLMDTYGMDLPYVQDIVQEMVQKPAVFNKHARKLQALGGSGAETMGEVAPPVLSTAVPGSSEYSMPVVESVLGGSAPQRAPHSAPLSSSELAPPCPQSGSSAGTTGALGGQAAAGTGVGCDRELRSRKRSRTSYSNAVSSVTSAGGRTTSPTSSAPRADAVDGVLTANGAHSSVYPTDRSGVSRVGSPMRSDALAWQAVGATPRSAVAGVPVGPATVRNGGGGGAQTHAPSLPTQLFDASSSYATHPSVNDMHILHGAHMTVAGSSVTFPASSPVSSGAAHQNLFAVQSMQPHAAMQAHPTHLFSGGARLAPGAGRGTHAGDAVWGSAVARGSSSILVHHPSQLQQQPQQFMVHTARSLPVYHPHSMAAQSVPQAYDKVPLSLRPDAAHMPTLHPMYAVTAPPFDAGVASSAMGQDTDPAHATVTPAAGASSQPDTALHIKGEESVTRPIPGVPSFGSLHTMDSSRLSYAPPAMLSQRHAAASPSQSRDHSRQGRRKLVVVAEAFPRPPSKSVTSGSPHSPDIELRDDDPMFSLSPTQLPDLMRSSDALPTTAPAKKYVGRGKQPRYDSEGTEASTLSTLPAEEHAQPVGRSNHAQDARVASSAGDGDATHTKPSAAPIATVPVLEEEEEYEHALGPGFGFDIGISLDF